MKTLISLLVSLAILALLYGLLDGDALVGVVAGTQPAVLALSLGLLVALVALSAVRLVMLAHAAGHVLDGRTALEATFAANAMNMAMPGKLGDLLKSFLLVDGGRRDIKSALSLSIWEKLADLALLFGIAALALGFAAAMRTALAFVAPMALVLLAGLFLPSVTAAAAWLKRALLGRRFGAVDRLLEAWRALQAELASRPGRLAGLIGVSALIWAGHLLQIALMAAALGVDGGPGFWLGLVGLVPIAILAGLVPLTFAGIGTRDAALVLLLAPLIGGETAAALGILFWLRYLVPGLIGLIFMPKFLEAARSFAAARKKA